MAAGTQYVYDGAAWQAANTPPPTPAPDVQNFISSGTWTKPQGARLILFEGISAGGAGSTGWSSGGDGGNYGRFLIYADALSDTVSVTIGAGVTPSANGSSGGATSFGSYSIPGGATGRIGGGSQVSGSAYFDGGKGGVGLTSGSSYSGMQNGQNSNFGAGGGCGGYQSTGNGGKGGTLASTYGFLQAGDGADMKTSKQATAPGGGSGFSASYPSMSGAARITTYF